MLQRFGSLYTDLRLTAGKVVLLQPAFFLVRRQIMAFAIVVCREILIVQIYLIWAQSTAAVYIIGLVNPYKANSQERTEYFNEAIQVAVLIMTMGLSDAVFDAETKVNLGYVVCGLIVFHLVMSVARMTGISLIRLKNKISRSLGQKRRKEQIETLRQQRTLKQEEEKKRCDGERGPTHDAAEAPIPSNSVP